MATLDRIDGGITVFLHCQGFNPNEPMDPENITVDVYVSPRELKEDEANIEEHVAHIVQDFGCKIAMPHLFRYRNRCTIDNVKPLQTRCTTMFCLSSHIY